MAEKEKISKPSYWAKLSLREKVLLAVLLIGALSYGFWEYIFKVQWEEFSAYRTQIEQLEQEVTQGKQTIKREEPLQIELDKAKKQLSVVLARFKSQSDPEMLLVRLGEIEKKTKIRITEFRPLQVQNRDHFTEIPVSLKFEGRYANIVPFLFELDKLYPNAITRSISLGLEPKTEATANPAQSTAKAAADAAAKQNSEKKVFKMPNPVVFGTLEIVMLEVGPGGQEDKVDINQNSVGRVNPFDPLIWEMRQPPTGSMPNIPGLVLPR